MTEILKSIFSRSAAAVAMLSLVGTAGATTIAVDFGSQPGFVAGSTSATYNVGNTGSTITAYGYCAGGSSANNCLGSNAQTALFPKNGGQGGSEDGLGLANDNSHDDEITKGTFIQLDLTALHADTVLLEVSSLTGPDTFQFYYSNTLGQEGTSLGSNYAGGATTSGISSQYSFSGYNYVSLAETAGGSANILLGPGWVNTGSGQLTTPEPTSVLMLGSGLLFGATLLRRRLMKTQSRN